MKKLHGIILILPANFILPEWIRTSDLRSSRVRRFLAKHPRQTMNKVPITAFIMRDCDARFVTDGAVTVRLEDRIKFQPAFPPGVVIAFWNRYEEHLAWNERYCQKCQLFNGHPIETRKQPDRRRFQCGTPGCGNKWHVKLSDPNFA